MDPNEMAAAFLPKASGPCRFGQYSVVLRNFFDQEGFEGVPIVDPNSTSDYDSALIPRDCMKVLTPLTFKGFLANDTLQNALLRVRPYEVNSGEADEVYAETHNGLVEFLKTNPSIKEFKGFMGLAVEKFEAVEREDGERRPLVLVSGEIFVRCNEQANQESIALLEQHGLEMVVDPISGWIDYVNRLNVNDSWSQKRLGALKNALIKRAYIKHASRQISKPFSRLLEGREFHSPYSFVGDLGRENIYGVIGGEGPVTVGAAYSFIKGHLEVDGIYHVGPFGCMQETAATSRVQALIQDQKMSGGMVIPFMDGVFGETKLPNLDAKIALFAENCKLRKELKGQMGKVK